MVVTEISHWGQDGKGFIHKREFPDVKDQTIVKMNNDTLYSFFIAHNIIRIKFRDVRTDRWKKFDQKNIKL